ncbi:MULTISPECIES: hypothetical protein [unclassified Streptomyces]|uniref:hypothetical protein n=1 Tax=unclassified Streptomyces TaxID=2593676 RepID=UPI001489073B|nr:MULTISPECIES: hypothetical protein [unclassified Streptomyces]
MSAPLVVNTKDGTCWTRRSVTRDGLALYAPEGVCKCPEFVMATLAELAEHGIVGSADVLPVPGGTEPQPSMAETLEKRTELLRIVQATARRQTKEIAGRKVYGDRLKTENAELTVELHQAKQYVRAVEKLLTERTPFGPRGQRAVLLAIGWLRESLDDYRGRVDAAEVFARRTQARINALLVEPFDLQGCALCGTSEDGHGVRVTDGFEHEWKRPTDVHVRERQAMQRQLERSASGEPHVSELAWLRARVAELEAERHSTNEALSDAAETLRANRDRIAELEQQLAAKDRPVDEDPIAYALTDKAASAVDPCHPCGCPKRFDRHAWGCPTTAVDAASVAADDVTPRVAKLRGILAGQRAAVEDPHDSPLHHDYRIGRDLPQAGGAS